MPRVITDLSFVPNTLAALPLLESEATLIAAGGLEADVHLSLHGPRPPQQDGEPSSGALWQFETRLHQQLCHLPPHERWPLARVRI